MLCGFYENLEEQNAKEMIADDFYIQRLMARVLTVLASASELNSIEKED